MIMTDNMLQFNKENFIPIRKENINSHYEFVSKELGKGAYGVVYKGRIKGTEGPWRAIKKIPKTACQDQTIIKNQIEILISIDNPNIVKLYEIYQYNQSVYLVTDLCEGGQLFDRLEAEGNPTQKQTKILFQQMLEAISYLHLQKIAHRDLKPENFLFLKEKSNVIKLIDFGLARRWKESLSKDLLSETGQIVGTSYYIAPEMIRHDYDERCDIWSLGVILYILITGSPPFDGDNDGLIMEAIKTTKYSLNIPEFKGVSREAKDLIFRMLMPAQKRISIEGIFAHPWMRGDVRTVELNSQFKKMCQFSKFSKIKKLTANYIAFQMSEKQVEKLAHLFRKMDTNHDGFIDMDELKTAFAEEKNTQNLQALKLLMEAINIGKNGKINYTQFLAANLPKQILFTPTNLLKMFRLMDKDGNGQVDRAELHEFFKNNQMDSLQGRNIDSIIEACDKDKNGSIDFEQFKAAVMM